MIPIISSNDDSKQQQRTTIAQEVAHPPNQIKSIHPNSTITVTITITIITTTTRENALAGGQATAGDAGEEAARRQGEDGCAHGRRGDGVDRARRRRAGRWGVRGRGCSVGAAAGRGGPRGAWLRRGDGGEWEIGGGLMGYAGIGCVFL